MKNNLEVQFQSSLFPIEFKAFKLAHTISPFRFIADILFRT